MSDFLPYGRQSIEDSDVEAVAATLREPLITQGPRVERFEAAFAQQVGARHAVAFSSGTAALHAAASAAGLGPGDLLLTTPISFVASSNCALFVGARPIFADIDLPTANLDVRAAAASGHLARAKACVIVSMAGLPADLQELQAAREGGLIVIEDACHALGGIRQGRPVGSGGADMTAFSLHPVKAVTTGEGGVIATERDDLAECLRTFRTHGIRRVEPGPDPLRGGWHYEIDSLGFNYRITDFQCALGQSQLGRLERFITARNSVAEAYHRLLDGVSGVITPVRAQADGRHAYHLYVVRFPEGAVRRRLVYDMLRAAGIGPQLHYIPIPAHRHYRSLGYSMEGLPNAQAYWEQALSLPIFPGMVEQDVERVARVIEEALRRPREEAAP